METDLQLSQDNNGKGTEDRQVRPDVPEERRGEPRFARESVPARVWWDGGSEPVLAQLLDVSTSGIRVRIGVEFAQDAEITVWFENAVVTGNVRYCRAVVQNSFEIGLRITDALNIV
jgi:hypothetical protein